VRGLWICVRPRRGANRQCGRSPGYRYGCHVRDVLLVQRERVFAARSMDRPSCNPMGGKSGFNTAATPNRTSLTLLASSATLPSYLQTYSPDSVPRIGTAASYATIRSHVSDHCGGWLSIPCTNCTTTPSTFVISWHRRTVPARGPLAAEFDLPAGADRPALVPVIGREHPACGSRYWRSVVAGQHR
jgi:hypothetical protein